MSTTETVTTAAELDALPIGSVVLDRSGDAITHDSPGIWACAETASMGTARLLRYGPFRVLYRPDTPVTGPEDDRPVGEVPPMLTLHPDGTITRAGDPYQALLTQLHEVKMREAALRAGIEGLVRQLEWNLLNNVTLPIEPRHLRALLDGEVRP